LKCYVCKKEIDVPPIIAAFTLKGRMFKIYFCSADCFVKFMKEETVPITEDDGYSGESYIG